MLRITMKAMQRMWKCFSSTWLFIIFCNQSEASLSLCYCQSNPVFASVFRCLVSVFGLFLVFIFQKIKEFGFSIHNPFKM